MITLYQFPGNWNLPNASPFCLKLETYLRMAEISYQNRFVMNPSKSPKGKLPYIKIDDVTLSDSELIIDFLKEKYGDVLDKDLSLEQRNLMALLNFTFCERLYWYMVYLRWQDDKGWQETKTALFNKLPFFSRLIVPGVVRKLMKKQLYFQGTGRHQQNEVIKLAEKTLDVIISVLGDKKYFAGDEVTSIDATAFGFLVNIVWVPFDFPMKNYLQNHRPILQYCERIWDTFYPELTKPLSLI